jgi:predicted SnoaL-like aldol condensation-catalyzing enzyme
MAIDRDLAFVHVRHLNWTGKEHAAVDIFRFNEDGKIVEHGDVLQPIPIPKRFVPSFDLFNN